ncbi:MAG: galactokinase [Anaerolineae bacterium]|nr:MAG: galactokinase [Anaerolineae bacterium]
MNLAETVNAVFQQKFGYPPLHIARAPGRVNLLGEHVDYNDGFVLPAAIDRATYLAFAPAHTEQTTVWAADFAQGAVFTPQTLAAKTQPDGSPLPDWARYPAGVMWALRQAGLETPALHAVFASNVPRGSGLSSSASVEMAFGVAWQQLGGWQVTPMELAKLGQRAENQYVGVNCGIMDQFASACGVEDRLLWLDCRSLEWETLALPPTVAIVVADTTVRRKLTSGEYNNRRAACEQAVQLLQAELPGIHSLRDVSLTDFNRLAAKLPQETHKRARHVVEEIERTQQAVALLRAGDVNGFGALMNACHLSLRDLYEVSCPELDVMVEIAQSLPGCYGARLTGAGFGGCTVNLVAQEQAPAFAQALMAGYRARTGLQPEIYICKASAGAGLL